MLGHFNKKGSNVSLLYNKILLLSRNKFFYLDLGLNDSFQNRIYLIFLHISFLLIKLKNTNTNTEHKKFYQKTFDYIFSRIEIDMREIGYGDLSVNKKMKILVKDFYNILLNCEKYKNSNIGNKERLFTKFLNFEHTKKTNNYKDMILYFDEYSSFCWDLSMDSVLKGELNFKYLK